MLRAMCTSLGGVLWKELINQIIEKEVKNKVSLHVWRLILLIIEVTLILAYFTLNKNEYNWYKEKKYKIFF